MSAIAAFLALSTPAALAQTAPVAEQAPPTVMVPPVAPTTAPAPAAAPVPTIRVPLNIAPESAPEAAPRPAAKTAQRPAAKTTDRPVASERSGTPVAAAAPVAAPPLPGDASRRTLDEPAATPVANPPRQLVVAEKPPSNGGFAWEIAGSAAVLLIAGGVAFVLAFRRRSALRKADAWEFDDAREDTERESVASAAASQAEPGRAPAFAAAPSGSMGRHEAMALVGPTADNPFETLAKRLKRARFLDRKERRVYEETLAAPQQPEPAARKPASAWEIAQRPLPVATEQEVRRPEPVARGLSHRFRRPDLARD